MAEHLVVEHEQEAPGGQESGHRLLHRVPGTSIDPTRAGREKETQMEIHKVGLRVMAAADTPGERRTTDGRGGHFTADQLDALAACGWHMPDLMGVMATRKQAMRSRLRSPATRHVDPTPRPSVVPAAHG